MNFQLPNFKRTFLLVIFICSLFSWAGSSWAAELVIPDSRRTTWQGNVGVIGGIPTDYANCTTAACNTLYGGSVSHTTINNALAGAPANTIVRIPAGTYGINGQITLPAGKSDVILRGAGMGVTILNNATSSNNIETEQTNTIAYGRPITSGYTQGSNSITVANADDVTVGQVLSITQSNSASAWACSGQADLLGFAAEIINVSGNVISFSPALPITLSENLNPTYSIQNPALLRVGFENFTLNSTVSGGADTIAKIWTSNEVWFKNVEMTGFNNVGIHFYNGSRGEVRDCKIHDIAGQDYYQEGYGIYLYSRVIEEGGSGGYLVENNLFYRTNMSIMLSRSSGNVIGYNYIFDIHHFDTAHDWVIPGININHGAYGVMNLVEGNIAPQIQNDGYHGSGSHDTIFRNHFNSLGNFVRPTDSRKPIDLARGSQYQNVIGNVLGDPSWTPDEYSMTGERDYSWSVIYRLGYPNMDNNGDTFVDTCADGVPVGMDSAVQSTLLRHKNYDYKNNAQRVCGSETEGCQSATNVAVGDTIPDSLYLASKPSWFGALAWPPANPTNGTVSDIPAKVFYDTGSWPTDDTTPPAVPSGLSVQ